MELSWRKRRMELRHPWTLSRGTAEFKEYWFVELSADGITGRGEAAHNSRYGESIESIDAFFQRAAIEMENADPARFQSVSSRIQRLDDGQASAKAAIDIALHDWAGKKLDAPLFEMFGLDPSAIPPTSFSIGIDSPDVVRDKIQDADLFRILKIKLGGANDEEIMRAVREVTDKTVRVDANEGWTDRQHALEKIQWLSTLNVEFIEQPMPAGSLPDMAWLKKRSPLRLFADEDVCGPQDVPKLASAYHGINIKLMKAGGIQPALQMIHTGRSAGLDIMLGCMIESSVGITAAAHLAPLVDHVDLDGNLLLKDDPFTGVVCEAGLLRLPSGPGLGVEPSIK